jgi:hypothetical protein
LTFEASFYGWFDPAKKIIQSFKQQDYYSIGEGLGMGLFYTFVGIEKAKKMQSDKM